MNRITDIVHGQGGIYSFFGEKMFEALRSFKAPSLVSCCNTLPYIICNEQNQQATLEMLANGIDTEEHQNHFHLGFSVWFNLDVICTTRADLAAIFDCDPAVSCFVYPILCSTILSSNSRSEFVRQFLLKISEYDAPTTILLEYEFDSLMKSTYGFLANEDNFNFIKTMLARGKLFFGQINLTNQSDMLVIQEWIVENNLKLKTLYLSNIPEWITQESIHLWSGTKNIISQLLQPSTQIIDAFYPTTKKDGSGPPQRISHACLPSYKVEIFRKRIAHPQITGPSSSSNSAELEFVTQRTIKRLRTVKTLFSSPPITDSNSNAETDSPIELLENKI